MAEVSLFTQQMQAMLPQWMKMAKDPTSVGAQFLNVFGVEFEAIRGYLDQLTNNQFIGTADIGQIDITYKVPLVLSYSDGPLTITSISGLTADAVGYTIKIVPTLREFYSATGDENVAIVDIDSALVYVRPTNELINANKMQPFQSVTINGTIHYDMLLHHVWNAFDEFGLLLGIQRLYSERNEDFKQRILDVFANPGNSTKDGILNALARELSISRDDISINELSSPAFKDSLLNDDGSASPRLVSYAQRINSTLGFTWDNMSWDDAYWRSIEEANLGLDYLPHIWDVTLAAWPDDLIQSGIGDGDDLLVRAPEKLDNTRNFNYSVGVRGSIKDGGLVYPEHSFKYKITATGTILNQESKPESYRYTVVASEIIYLYFIVRAFQQYDHLDVIDFSNLTGFRYDNASNLEVVTGNTVMSLKADPVLEIQAFMETTVKSSTPSLDSLTVTWKDSTGTSHDFIIDTQAQIDENDSSLVTEKENVLSTPAGSVQLGYGDFYHVINSKGDWQKGTFMNAELKADGSIQLVRPKI